MDKARIKESIIKHEKLQTGCSGIKVVNVVVKKDEILADVIMNHDDGYERFNRVKYSRNIFEN